MSNRYGNFTPLPSDRRSQMARDAAKTRKAIHPTKDDIVRSVEYYKSLSPMEQLRINKARESSFNVFSILCGLAFLSIPFLFFSLWFT